jgi:hypothetical protein
VSDKPISFELSIGNAGNSLDGEHLSGKVDHVDTHAHEDDGKENKSNESMRTMVRKTENRRDWKHVSGKVDHVDTHAHEDDGK